MPPSPHHARMSLPRAVHEANATGSSSDGWGLPYVAPIFAWLSHSSSLEYIEYDECRSAGVCRESREVCRFNQLEVAATADKLCSAPSVITYLIVVRSTQINGNSGEWGRSALVDTAAETGCCFAELCSDERYVQLSIQNRQSIQVDIHSAQTTRIFGPHATAPPLKQLYP